jgi:hypothetical protein
VVIIDTRIGGFHFHNTQKSLFLLSDNDLERFNQFYQDFIDNLNEKALKNPLLIFSFPFPSRVEKKLTAKFKLGKQK